MVFIPQKHSSRTQPGKYYRGIHTLIKQILYIHQSSVWGKNNSRSMLLPCGQQLLLGNREEVDIIAYE